MTDPIITVAIGIGCAVGTCAAIFGLGVFILMLRLQNANAAEQAKREAQGKAEVATAALLAHELKHFYRKGFWDCQKRVVSVLNEGYLDRAAAESISAAIWALRPDDEKPEVPANA